MIGLDSGHLPGEAGGAFDNRGTKTLASFDHLPLRRVLRLMAPSVRDESEPKHARIFERLADP
jgi:hypothetical protein